MMARRPLLIVALLEAGTLAVLFVNLATANAHAVAAVVGPVHGTAYLVGVGLAWQDACPRWRRLLAALPGVGALLAWRLNRVHEPSGAAARTAGPRPRGLVAPSSSAPSAHLDMQGRRS